MPNQLIDSTYLVDAQATTALSWPGGARFSQVRILALDTTAAATFTIVAGGTPIFRFAVLTQGAGTSIQPALFTFPLGGVRYPTAWIPTTLTACTAWIDFL